jgi:hypothetical protein
MRAGVAGPRSCVSACHAGRGCSPRSSVVRLPCGHGLQSSQLCFSLAMRARVAVLRSDLSACRAGKGCSPSQLAFSLPCGHGLQSGQSPFRLPCGQGLQSAQLRFSLPCGHGLQSAQSRFSLPCGQGLQSTQLPFQLVMRARVAVRALAFQPAVRARVAPHAVVLQLAVRAPLPSSHHARRSSPFLLRARSVCHRPTRRHELSFARRGVVAFLATFRRVREFRRFVTFLSGTGIRSPGPAPSEPRART